VISQEVAAGLLFAGAAGRGGGTLTVRGQDRDGTRRYADFGPLQGRDFVRWAARVGQVDELRLDLVPRERGRERPLVHVLWVDSAPLRLLERFRPRPNLVVEHSEGAFGLWQLGRPMRAARALDALAGLAAALDGDRRAVSLEYRARVPGTVEPHSGSAVTAVFVDLTAHSPEGLLRAVSGHRRAA